MDNFFKKHYTYLEAHRTTKGFNWDTVNTELGNPCSNGEKLRSKYKHWRKKNNVLTPTCLSPTTLTSHSSIGFIYPDPNILTSPNLSTLKPSFFIENQKEDLDKGTKEFKFTADTIPTHEEIITHFNIDTIKYRINQIYHKTSFGGKYAITVSLLANKGNEGLKINTDFIESLKNITKAPIIVNQFKTLNPIKPKCCILIPKQDVHWNKLDIGGNNSIENRFSTFVNTITSQLAKATLTNSIEKIVYIVGSDEFNSEWTGGTTKGTPQQNILSYQEVFEKVSSFSIEFIKLLKTYTTTVEVVLLNGNHDHNVSWHLANLLKHVFSNSKGVSIDTELVNTKIISYKSNLVLINHGDEMKPKDLATKFPIIAKDKWSNHDNYFVISGDKHHEQAYDYNGIRTYQVPQLSNARSLWDDKKGHLCSKAESVLFLFEKDGLSNILRKTLK